jgi:hypothetical protein
MKTIQINDEDWLQLKKLSIEKNKPIYEIVSLILMGKLRIIKT